MENQAVTVTGRACKLLGLAILVQASGLVAAAHAWPAQDYEPVQLLEVWGPKRAGQFGHSTAAVGDVDNDGTPDFAVGSPGESQGPLISGGAVRIVSGKTGAILGEYREPGFTDQLGFVVIGLGGDIDGDNVPDLAVGAPGLGSPGAPYVRVLSGADMSIISTIIAEQDDDAFGSALAAADLGGTEGDPDFPDTIPDLLIGAPDFDGAAEDTGIVYVLSGRKIAENALIQLPENVVTLWTLKGKGGAGDRFGRSVMVANVFGGKDGRIVEPAEDSTDPILDIIVGATQNLIGGPGYVRAFAGVLDGPQFVEVTDLPDESSNGPDLEDGDTFGFSLGAFDILGFGNGLLIGAPGRDDDVVGDGAGCVWDFGVADGQWFAYRKWRGVEAGDGFGWDMDAPANGATIARDMDDAIDDDFVVSAYQFENPPDPGYVQVIEVVSGDVAQAVKGEVPGTLFGRSVSVVGDLDGDGNADFVVGSDYFSTPIGLSAGRVQAFAIGNADTVPWNYGFRFPATSLTQGSISLDTSNPVAGAPVFLSHSYGPGFEGFLLLTDEAERAEVVLGSTLLVDTVGSLVTKKAVSGSDPTWSIDIPMDLASRTLYLQATLRDTSTSIIWKYSNGIAFVVDP